MEDVLKRLYEIESAASAVKKDTERKKLQLEAAMKKKTEQFDADIIQRTNMALAQQKSQLNAQIENELSAQKKEVETVLYSLEQEYNSHHTDLAQEILSKLIKD